MRQSIETFPRMVEIVDSWRDMDSINEGQLAKFNLLADQVRLLLKVRTEANYVLMAMCNDAYLGKDGFRWALGSASGV